MRKTALITAALAGAAYLLRRNRRFGPLSAMAAGAILEQVVVAMRKQEPASKPSLWSKLTAPKPPAPAPAE